MHTHPKHREVSLGLFRGRPAHDFPLDVILRLLFYQPDACRVWDLRLGVWDFGFEVWGKRYGVKRLPLRV
jgi:hypothetical protein